MMTDDSIKIPIGTHHFLQRYLLAFATQAEVLNHVRTQAIGEEAERIPGIIESWNKLQPKVTELVRVESGLPDTIGIEPVPDECQPYLESVTRDPLFQKTFASLPSRFAMVEIDKLVAPQRTVNLDYVRKLSHRFSKSPNLAELLDFCVSHKREMDPIQHLEIAQNTHVFSSPNSDIRFLGAFVKDLADEDLNYAVLGGLPAAAIIAFIGYGGAPLNAFLAGRRVILNNGFHRAYALRSIGVTRIPLVIQQVRNAQLEFPPVVLGLPKEYLLNFQRPVLMKDFFVPEFAITLKVRERIKMVTLGIALNQHDVPA